MRCWAGRRFCMSRTHGWISFKASVSQLFSLSQIHFALKATDVKREAMSTEIWSVWVWPIPCFRLTAVPNSVLCTWSDPRKRSETLVSMNRLTHPALTYLWWCISGISCSQSECTNWIDVFSTWFFPHNKDKALLSNSIEKCFYFLVAYWALNIFTACSLLLRCEAEVNQSELGSGQAPFSRTLLSEKGVLVSYSLINIERWLSWRWTKCDVRSVISGFSAYQWWWIIQSLLLPLNTEYNRVMQNAAEAHILLYKRGKFVVWLMYDSFSFYHRKVCRKAHLYKQNFDQFTQMIYTKTL